MANTVSFVKRAPALPFRTVDRCRGSCDLHVMLRTFFLPVAIAALAALPAAATAGGGLPMAGNCATTFTVGGTGAISITGSCVLTHLGRTTYRATQIVTPNADGTVHIAVDGIYTAANGDELHGVISGTGSFGGGSSVSYTTTETFVGGTGRFAHASGAVTDTGIATFTSATAGLSTYSMLGSISY